MVRIKNDSLVGGDNGILHMTDYVGLSTDTMPTAGLVTGSSFFAIDTGETYYFDEEAGTWAVPVPAPAEETVEEPAEETEE